MTPPASGPAAGRPLENYANNSSPAGQSPRESRYERRGLLWSESDLERVRKCGRVAVTQGGSVAVRLRDGVAGFAGLASCGSIWADPVCNAKIMARRALEIGAAVAGWQAAGGQVVLVTLTEQHRAGERLGRLWDDAGYAWSRTTMGKPWAADRAAYGIAGYLRLAEVTIGVNGWHPHLHALLFIEGGHLVDVEGLHARLFERWARALGRRGRLAVMAASDAKLVSGPADEALASYLTKAVDRPASIGLEVTWSQSKKARRALSTETPWSLLDHVAEGDADALDLWHEWERASRGRRAHTWSQGIRDRLALGVEKTDDEIAGEEIGSNDDDLVIIDAAGWDVLCQRPANLALVLEFAEAGGLFGLRIVLDRLGVSYVPVGSRSPQERGAPEGPAPHRPALTGGQS